MHNKCVCVCLFIYIFTHYLRRRQGWDMVSSCVLVRSFSNTQYLPSLIIWYYESKHSEGTWEKET